MDRRARKNRSVYRVGIICIFSFMVLFLISCSSKLDENDWSELVKAVVEAMRGKDFSLSAAEFHDRYPDLEFESNLISAEFTEKISFHRGLNISINYSFTTYYAGNKGYVINDVVAYISEKKYSENLVSQASLEIFSKELSQLLDISGLELNYSKPLEKKGPYYSYSGRIYNSHSGRYDNVKRQISWHPRVKWKSGDKRGGRIACTIHPSFLIPR